MFSGKEQILAALEALSRRLALDRAEPVSLLVCGAAALNYQDLLIRGTQDVDVLGLTNRRAPLRIVAGEFTGELREAVARVAVELRFPSDWLNDKANLVHANWGLPPGAFERARRTDFGPCLRVLWLHHQDLAALKLLGALDKDPAEALRHFRDLMEIEPTPAEMKSAVAWLLDRPASEEFWRKVYDVAERFGVENLTDIRAKSASGKPLRRRARRKKA
ncbi:MAG: hypothetical protein NTY01_15405 [Verrucomicrobia bacterium]|nr:hypothetical protein [Verrucomicrobiota bacterium]